MKLKVLIVDDEPDVLESTAGLVESLGYDAVRLSGASEILDAVEREKPAVLLQDLKMPGLNVSGLVAALRSNPATADIPIVFFSANADLPGTAARLDAWGYLSKPFAKQDLARLLREAMGAPGPVLTKSGHALHRDVRGVFHDFWNLLAALSNYVVILDESPDLPKTLQKTVRGLDDVVLQLESKTDRLQSYLLGLVDSIEPEGRRDSSGESDPIAGSH
ncbi:MAG TPA: response regulator [Candidatus Thermoplasmatota archaeon]